MWEEIADIAVVGAGPAGSASALRVLQLRPDARVLLLDAATFPRDKTCGDGVAAHVFDLLHALDVPDLRPLGPAVPGLRLRSPGGQVVARRCARPNHPIPRAVFDARLVEAAVEAGVRHVVYTSFVGAGETAGFLLGRDHGATEDAIRASGLEHTFLRDNFYVEVWADFAGTEAEIRGPAGDGRMAAVSRLDVSAVAAHVLRDPAAHAGATYDLTGPQALTLDEAAGILTDVTGRPHRFVDETMDEARASRSSYRAPDWLVDAWISTYTAVAAGEMDAVTDDVERVSGRPPLTLSQLLGQP